MVSLRALIADAIGFDPDAPRGPTRPAVSEALARCPRGGVVAAQDGGGDEVAVVRLVDGRAFVVADRCPHDGGLLSDGFVDGDRLVCARHGWEVDPCTGACTRGRTRVGTRAILDPSSDDAAVQRAVS
jgi:nitrite reductase/ring-hydroxylating ferredoxin subunit